MSTGADRAIAKVLVVDDDEADRSLARSTLEESGYEVILAAGSEAIAAFETTQPDCVVLDLRIPDVNDGLAICELIRALTHGSETPILFVTSLSDVDTFDRALGAGGADFLTKPIRPTELVVRVQAALKVQRMTMELREHYELVQRQRDDLVRMQRQRRRLTAFVVHDLKNPVNSMDLHAQILLREETLRPSARESAAQIRTEARQLSRLIAGLLDIAKADEGQLSPRCSDLDLRALLDGVLAELGVDAQRRGVTLRYSLEVDRIHADEDLFRRTLTNLVENAIRYAPPETPVTVTAAPLPAATEVRVADRGHGIPAEMRETVFDPFVQIESGEHPVTRIGRGLGLTFCKLAIEAHGGRVWVEDGVPGAVFCMRLPVEPGAIPSRTPQ